MRAASSTFPQTVFWWRHRRCGTHSAGLFGAIKYWISAHAVLTTFFSLLFTQISDSDDNVQELHLVRVSSLCFYTSSTINTVYPFLQSQPHGSAVAEMLLCVCVWGGGCIYSVIHALAQKGRKEKWIYWVYSLEARCIYLTTNPAMDGVVIVSSGKSMGFKGKAVDLWFLIELYPCIAVCILEEWCIEIWQICFFRISVRRAGQRQGQRWFLIVHWECWLSSLFCECVYALKVCLPVRSVAHAGLPAYGRTP